MATNVPARQSNQAVQGRVIPPKRQQQSINVTYNVNTGSGTGPNPNVPSQGSGGGGFNFRNLWVMRQMQQPAQRYSVPNGVPRFLGNSQIIGYAAVGAAIVIGFDEWHNNGILPRPVRLWSTLWVYGLLALMALVPMMVPIANVLALGYLFVLLWQYYNGSGQFGGRGVGVAEGSGGKL